MRERLTLPDGSWFEIVRSAADLERDPGEILFSAPPGAQAPPPHVHRRQREVFTLHEGDFELLVDGEWRALSPGESVVIEPGVTHTYRNEGSATALVTTVHEPDLQFEEYIRRLCATVIEHGSVKATPGLAVRLAALWREYDDTISPSGLPLKVGIGVLGRVGPLVGLRPK